MRVHLMCKNMPIDEELAKNLPLLVGIEGKILVLLKCIVGLVCLVLIGIIYIVCRLEVLC